MKKFCFICGKETDDLIEGMCSSCYSKKLKLAEIPEKMEIIKCPSCEKVKIREKWIDEDTEKIILDRIKMINKVNKIYIKKKKENEYEIVLKRKIGKETKEELHNIKIHYDKRMCELCGKMKSGYYECIIQLRGNLNESIVNKIEKELEALPDIFFHVKELKGGIDFYLSNKSAGEKIAKFMKEKYNANVKKSFTLVTQKEGRDVYRTTFCIRI